MEEALQVDPSSFNLQNPYFSDGFDTLPAETDTAWMVIRWQISPDEKAPIPIHCHIDAHLGAGMMMVLMQDPDHFPTVPDEYANGDGIPAGWTKPTVNGWSR